MKLKQNKFTDINLTLFDEGAEAPGGAEGVQGTVSAGEDVKAGDADQDVTKVVYGKQEEETKISNEEKKQEEKKQEEETTQVDYSNLTKEEAQAKYNELVNGPFKDLFTNHTQQIINKRFKETKTLESQLGEINPIVNVLKEKYGVEDTKELLEKIEAESIEELAFKNDMSVEQYKEIHKLRQENQQLKSKYESETAEKEANERINDWYKQSEALKEKYPDFDLKEASTNDQFMDLLRNDISVEAAYQAAYFDKIINNVKATVAKQAATNVTDNIQARNSRTKEAGAKTTPGMVVKASAKDLTAKDRAEIAKRAARGETIKF